MSYDDTILKDQGSPKISEIAVDRIQEVISIPESGNSLVALEQLRRLSVDALRRQNYILHSDGELSWDGSEIRFDSNGRTNHIIFRILQTEIDAIRTVDLRLNGSITGNTSNTFESISLNDQELLYLEIDTNRIRSSGPSGVIDIENAVGGGSLNSGYTLKKIALSSTTGMPQFNYPRPDELTGSIFPTTFFVPLCFRADWTDGSITYQDIWWIPHGIRWPSGVVSTIGDVIVRGLETYGDYYVRTQAELQTAITALSSIGGNIIISAPFTIDSSITIHEGIRLMGRSSRGTGSPKAALTFASSGKLTMSARSQLKDIYCVCTTSFASSAHEQMVEVSGGNCIIDGVNFNLLNTGGYQATALKVSSANNRILNCRFQSVISIATRIGIDYAVAGAIQNIELYSEFS